MWICLPNIPLYFWDISFFKSIKNSIGHFFKVDEAMDSLGHSTSACILVNVDISTPLLGDVVLMVVDRPWTQLLDNEDLPFLCQCCLSTGCIGIDYSLLH